MDKDTARLKKETMIRRINELPSLLVAFSGGVDSSFLLAVAHQVLGDRVTAATSSSMTYPSREQAEAAEFTRKRNIRHIIFESEETKLPEFISNTPDRCYHCKKSLSRRLIELARERNIHHIAHAANLDDLNDYRPGIKAAREMGILSPLLDNRLGKDEIRFLSREMGLETWDKPAMACLASRIPYGSPITAEKLKMVQEAEEVLAENGFKLFRVRHHGTIARIEVGGTEIGRMTEETLRKKIVERLREIGFTYISIDLEGYIPGSMNRELEHKGHK
jgi:uncharacterized protein